MMLEIVRGNHDVGDSQTDSGNHDVGDSQKDSDIHDVGTAWGQR